MDAAKVEKLINDKLAPSFVAEREKLDRIDNWYRWNHDSPHQPRQATTEYKQLSERAQTPWLNLVVTSVAQALFVDGYRRADDALADAEPWAWWQANGMDARQISIHRAALAYGLSYASVMPGVDPLTKDPMPVIRGYTPRRMMAFYGEPEHDEWPMYALRMDPKGGGLNGYDVWLYDDEKVWIGTADGFGGAVQINEFREHNAGVCPIVRYANGLDLEGRSSGEVEPFIPVASRIDQTVFDRLVVQRFASWVVRYIAGMAKPDGDDEQVAQMRLRLKVEDLLISEDPDTKFGTLEATQLEGFIKAAEADIRTLAAVSQTPAHELLGQLANLSAEALAAARASLTAKVQERQHFFGESHEQMLRLAAFVMGDTAGASDRSAQVRWADTETRSLAQAADALGKMATMLGIPVEMLWEKVPGFTQQDVERAKALIDSGKAVTGAVKETPALIA